MVVKEFEIERESLNVDSKATCEHCVEIAATRIGDAVMAWVKEALPALVEVVDGKAKFKINCIVTLSDGV